MQRSLLARGALFIAVSLLGAGCGESTNPAGPTKLGITLNQLSVTAGANMSIQVAVQDAAGNTVAGSTAPVTIALGANPGAATLLGDATVDAVNGVATFNDLHIEKAAQGYTLVATSGSLASATSDAFQVVHDVATKVGFLAQPSTASAGVPFTIQVAAQDQFNNVASSVTGGVTIAFAANPGSGTLSGTTTAAMFLGVATFADLSIDKVALDYTLSATSSSLAAATSAPIAVNPGAAAKLAFLALGASYQSAAFIGNPARVRILDAHDNHVTTATNSVTISIGANPGSGTLAGTLTRSALTGQADFSGVSINKAGTGYTLVASATGLQSGTSSAFAITPGTPSQLQWLDQPAANNAAGVPLPTFRIAVQDAAGNVVGDQGITVNLTVSVGPSGGKLVAFPDNEGKFTVEGIATFSTIKFDRPGTYTLRATSQTYFKDANPVSVQLAFSKVTVGGGPTFSAPITEARHACSLSTAGAVHCWGGSVWGALGTEPSNSVTNALQPALVATAHLYKDVEAGNLHTCGVTIAGAAYCWGSNLNGRLGDGQPGTKSYAVAVASALHFVSISAGDTHTCGVTSSGPGVLSGPAYCWGSNASGQLGDGTFDERPTPALVSGGLSFISVSASHGAHTCGITTDFLTYCWGINLDGQVGDNSTTMRNVPTLVQNAATHLFRSVSTGRFHTCAVQADNAAYCWGANTSQQLGDGNTAQTDRLTPSLVTASVTGVNGGWLHTCGIGGGTAFCWGANDSGQLGDGGTTERNAPGAISGSLNITQVAAGQDFSCGVTADNRIYCWGKNDLGQLGDGTTTQRLSPVRIFP